MDIQNQNANSNLNLNTGDPPDREGDDHPESGGSPDLNNTDPPAGSPPSGGGGVPTGSCSSTIKVAQQNIHRSPPAGDELLHLNKDIDILQEMPLKHNGQIKTISPL